VTAKLLEIGRLWGIARETDFSRHSGRGWVTAKRLAIWSRSEMAKELRIESDLWLVVESIDGFQSGKEWPTHAVTAALDVITTLCSNLLASMKELD
jgi:hypothetical protein